MVKLKCSECSQETPFQLVNGEDVRPLCDNCMGEAIFELVMQNQYVTFWNDGETVTVSKSCDCFNPADES